MRRWSAASPTIINGVGSALTNGTLVSTNSELGKAYAEFAETLLAQDNVVPPKAPSSKRKFLEFLAVPSEAVLTQDN